MRQKRLPLIDLDRPVFRTLALAYALLLQAILGSALASTHAFAMAERQALGLAALCADREATHPAQHVPAGPASDRDCFNCKTACVGTGGQIALPQPLAPSLVPPTLLLAPAPRVVAQSDFPPASRFPSDLANRAPPVRSI